VRRTLAAFTAAAAMLVPAALTIASATAASATTVPKPIPLHQASSSVSSAPMSIALYHDGTSTAYWNYAGDAVLTSGASGNSAQIDVLNPPATAPTVEPAFTPSFASGSNGHSPYWAIELHSGALMLGFGPGNWYAQNGSGGSVSGSYAAARTYALANPGPDNWVVAAFIGDADPAAGSVTVSSVQYNGTTFAPSFSTQGLISNAYSHKCLDVTAGNYAAGGLLQQYTCGASAGGVSGANQKFRIIGYPDGTSSLQAVNTAGDVIMCVVSSTKGAQLTLANCAGQTVAKSGPYYKFPVTGLVMDDTGWSTANGAKVQGWTQTGGLNQQWSMP
jgi:hypothetical protein